MPTNRDGLTRRKIAATIVAKKHDVPDAVSQLNVKTAPYGDGRGVTGGTRVMRLCRPGTFRPLTTPAFFGSAAGSRSFVHRSSPLLIDGAPHASTKPTSRR